MESRRFLCTRPLQAQLHKNGSCRYMKLCPKLVILYLYSNMPRYNYQNCAGKWGMVETSHWSHAVAGRLNLQNIISNLEKQSCIPCIGILGVDSK